MLVTEVAAMKWWTVHRNIMSRKQFFTVDNVALDNCGTNCNILQLRFCLSSRLSSSMQFPLVCLHLFSSLVPGVDDARQMHK